MRALAGRAATLVLCMALFAACVSTLVAKTPEQRAYAAISEYVIVAEAAVEYAESPAADVTIVIQLASLDDQAQKIIAQIERTVRATIAEDARERTLADLTRILDFFREAMVLQLLEVSP